MKNINFIKSGMENFCCYTDLMEYEFKNDKIVMITGPNGSGKSSLYDSIQFTFFGVTGKGARSEEAVNNVVGKNCHTFVELTSETNGIVDKYRIDRYVKHSKLGDTVLLFKNDDPKPYKKGHKEVLPEIEKILVPQKLFTNTLLFGQKVKDFFTDLPDSERKDIFRKVLQLDNYVLYYDETNKKIKQKNIDLEELYKNINLNSKFLDDTIVRINITKEDIKKYELRKIEEIEALTNKIDQLNLTLYDLKDKEKLFENSNDYELNRLNEKISLIQNEINKIDMELDGLLKSLLNTKSLKEEEFNSKCQELLSTEELNKTKIISELNKDFQEYKSEMQKIISKLTNDADNYNLKFSNNKKEIIKNKPEILKLKESLNTSNATCPTCGKLLTEESIKNHLIDTLNRLEKTNEELLTENNNLINLTDEIIKDLEKNNNTIDTCKEQTDLKVKEIEKNSQLKVLEIKQRLGEAKNKLNVVLSEKKKNLEIEYSSKRNNIISNLNEMINEKNELLKELREKSLLIEQINKVNNDLELNKVLIENKKVENHNLSSILENYFVEKTRLEEEKIELDKVKSEIISELEILDFWKIGFSSSGIPSLLIDESIPFLNEKVEYYLDMVGGRYKASFDTLSTTKSGEYRDKINVNVLDTQSKANSRKQLSGGQTRIIDIAILLSLCDLQNNIQDMRTNILLLDEVFDSLDDQNIGYVSSLLRTLVKEKSINIISHRHIDSIEADEIIRLF